MFTKACMPDDARRGFYRCCRTYPRHFDSRKVRTTYCSIGSISSHLPDSSVCDVPAVLYEIFSSRFQPTAISQPPHYLPQRPSGQTTPATASSFLPSSLAARHTRPPHHLHPHAPAPASVTNPPWTPWRSTSLDGRASRQSTGWTRFPCMTTKTSYLATKTSSPCRRRATGRRPRGTSTTKMHDRTEPAGLLRSGVIPVFVRS